MHLFYVMSHHRQKKLHQIFPNYGTCTVANTVLHIHSYVCSYVCSYSSSLKFACCIKLYINFMDWWYRIQQTFWGEMFVVREENGYLWENFCSSMLVDLYCQSTRPWFIGRDSQLCENRENRKSFLLKSPAIYDIAYVTWF